MRVVKISMMFRDPDFFYDFQKKHGGSFWEQFFKKFSQSYTDKDYVTEKKGSMQCLFYLPSDKADEALHEEVTKLISEIVPDADESYVLSVTEMDTHELSMLKDRSIPGLEDKKWFSQALSEKPPKEEKEQSEQASEKPTVRTASADSKPDGEEYTLPKTLFEQMERIAKLKKGLLEKVHGQRHAIDELTQSIFESEAFTAHNENRKGPLATFLFAGPSGVGKTFLAQQCGELLDRPMLVVDMSEYSDNLSNGKFNGEHGETAVVTGFVRSNPNGIILFDEIEKAHINTIHLFLQILDAGRLMDMHLKREVSFKDTIIIMTTNAGHSLYDDNTVCDLSNVPTNVILEALRTDTNPATKEPFFPECITTRMANGQVILFNHLEPYALMEIVRDEIALEISLFKKAYNVDVIYDSFLLTAVVLYSGGGISDARTLRGLARKAIVKELQEIALQLSVKSDKAVNDLKTVRIEINPSESDESIQALFINQKDLQVAVFSDESTFKVFEKIKCTGTEFSLISNPDEAKKRVRGVTDYILLDPHWGVRDTERMPNDIEDIVSDGMELYYYLLEYCPETPIYILDTKGHAPTDFETLLANGARGVIRLSEDNTDDFSQALAVLSFNALINNSTFSIGRSGKILSYNCAQYFESAETSVISFSRMALKAAPRSNDGATMAKKGANTDLTFKDIIGCKKAKQTLSEYRDMIENPRDTAINGKRIPKGVLLYGPPGTGKTMLAKAFANEVDASFFPVTASAFFGSLVGESEKNIRDLFKKARRYAPSIIFVDEVDVIGRLRTGSETSIHNEDALNAFLAEMDGFVVDEKRPVFILAATNYNVEGRSRVLDPAFLRRFDRKIYIDLPDSESRAQLINLSLKKHGINLGEAHDKVIENFAMRSAGMNNADLEKVVDIFLSAVADTEPSSKQLMDALDSFRFGEVNELDPDDLRQTACHEAGHALVYRLCGETPAFLTVVARGGYAGFMEHAQDDKKGAVTYKELMDRVCCSLAGRVAELEVYGEELGMNTGAGSDIKNVRALIRACLDDYAMGENMFSVYKSSTAEEVFKAQYERTQTMIRDNLDCLTKLTDLLAQEKCLDQAQLKTFFSENLASE